MGKEKTRVIYLEISYIADAAGPQLCDGVLGLHAFTGCNSTSAFAGKGKKTALKICKTDAVACERMAFVGRSFDVETVLFSECEGFVCKMYGRPNWLTLTNVVMLPFVQSRASRRVFRHAKMHYEITVCVQTTKRPSGVIPLPVSVIPLPV